MTPLDIAQAKGADTFVFDYAHADVAQTFVFDGGNWGNFMTEGYLSVADEITPDVGDAGLSLAGSYRASVTLFHLDAFSSAHVSWEGSGFTVEYSMDNATWLPLTQHGAITLNADADFDIRVNFAGGVENDPAHLTRLTVRVMKTDTMLSNKNRTASYSADLFTDEGLVILGGGLLSIMPTDVVPPVVGTFEFIARIDTITGWGTIFETEGVWSGIGLDEFMYAGGATILIDGQVVTDGVEVAAGEFHHFVFIPDNGSMNRWFSVGVSGDGTNGANLTVSHLALYQQSMTVAEAQALYDAQDGLTFRVDDPGAVAVTEPATPTDIYAYAWSVITS